MVKDYQGNYANFNSHAHVERDLHIRLYHFLRTISTHTLTWSVTERGERKMGSKIISTHTLTWSVTGSENPIKLGKSYFNSHAHVERDQLHISENLYP